MKRQEEREKPTDKLRETAQSKRLNGAIDSVKRGQTSDDVIENY